MSELVHFQFLQPFLTFNKLFFFVGVVQFVSDIHDMMVNKMDQQYVYISFIVLVKPFFYSY